MDVFQRLWQSASTLSDELAERNQWHDHPSAALEKSFNGGVAAQVGAHYAKILTSAPLPPDARILDLGCGFGRMAMALAKRLGPGQRYFGLDPNADGITWAQRNIAPHCPNFSFDRIDIRSLPYNPKGQLNGSQFRFPFPDGSLDLVFMISVLTHVDLATVRTYAQEAARCLKPDSGRLVTTIFLLDDEVDRLLAAGRGSFRMGAKFGPSRVENPANPELAIAHPRHVVQEILTKAGFAQTTLLNGSWSGRQGATPMDFQDLVVADRAPGPPFRMPDRTFAPPEERTADLHRICDQLAARFASEDALMRFIIWANAISFNAFWWQCEDQTLSLPDDPQPLTFEALRDLGLADLRPKTSGGAQYHPLDEPALVDLLIRTGRAPSRHALLVCLCQAAENGLRVEQAQRAGQRITLQGAGRPPQTAPLPPFAA